MELWVSPAARRAWRRVFPGDLYPDTRPKISARRSDAAATVEYLCRERVGVYGIETGLDGNLIRERDREVTAREIVSGGTSAGAAFMKKRTPVKQRGGGGGDRDFRRGPSRAPASPEAHVLRRAQKKAAQCYRDPGAPGAQSVRRADYARGKAFAPARVRRGRDRRSSGHARYYPSAGGKIFQ